MSNYPPINIYIIMFIFNSSVKRETLKLIETFLDKAEDQPHIGKQCVPPMMDPVLGDYARNLPDARESEVLSLFATIINKYASTSLVTYVACSGSGCSYVHGCRETF